MKAFMEIVCAENGLREVRGWFGLIRDVKRELAKPKVAR